MKKRVLVFILMLFGMFFMLKPNIKAILNNSTDLIRIHSSNFDYTVTTKTKISDIIAKFGEPKIKTNSAFGGYAYTFYTDNNYSNYLYIETNKDDQKIMSYGTVSPGYEIYGSGYDESYPYYDTSHMQGIIFNKSSKVRGGVYYNRNQWTYTEMVDTYVNNYNSNPTLYLRGISEHAVTMYKAILANEGYTSNMEFDEEMFYVNEQMKEQGKNIRDYSGTMGKLPYRISIGTRFNLDLNVNNYYLLNPGIFANFYYTEVLNDQNMDPKYTHAIFDYNIDNKLATAIVVTDDIFTYWDKVTLTSTENTKLNNARSQYNDAISKFKQNGDIESQDIFKTVPASKVASQLVAGELKDNIKAGINSYYNSIRAGQGLSLVTQNSAAATQAQHMAVLLSFRFHEQNLPITHSPERPEGVSESFYNTAIGWDSESYAENVAMAREAVPTAGQAMRFINQFMDDSSETPYNLGHRTSLLIPSNDSLGFGIAKSIGVMEFDHNQNNAVGINVVAWPSEGVTFMEHLDSYRFNWSTKFYNTLGVNKDTIVNVKCLTTGETWDFTTTSSESSHFYRKDYTGPQEFKDKVIFGDSSLVPQPGFVYEIAVSNLTNISTGATNASYKYRSVFEYADTSKYPTSVNSVKIDRSTLKKVGSANKYYVPVDRDFKLNAILDANVTDIKVTWSSSDSNVKVTQNGILDIPDNYTNGKEFNITLKSDATGISDTVTLVTYKSKDTIHFNPSELSLSINDTAKTISISSIDSGYTGNVDFKIIYDSMPNTYLDITDEKVTQYMEITKATNGRSINIIVNKFPSYGGAFKVIATADTNTGIYEGIASVTIENPITSVRLKSKLEVPFYVITSTNSGSTDGTSYFATISLNDLRNTPNANSTVSFDAEALPKDNTLDNKTDWSIVTGDDVITLKNNDGDITINKYGYAILRATNVPSQLYSDMALYIQEPLQSISIAGSSQTFIYNEENHQTDNIIVTRVPENNFTPIKFKSSNTNIATVDDNGLVVFKGKEGNVTITATSSNLIEDNAKTATYEYTVKVPVRAISFETPKKDIVIYNYSSQSPTIVPNISGMGSHITYVSSDTDVATVTKSGSVYGEKPGNATITATVDPTYTNGENVTASYEVRVLNPISTFTINGTYSLKIIDKGYKFETQIRARNESYPCTDDYTTQWSSDDTSIAIVSEDGFVEPVAPGSTYINATIYPTYTDINGNVQSRTPITKRYKLTISNVTLKANLNKTNLNVGEKVNMTAILTPNYSVLSSNIIYVSSNPSVATVDSNGKITAIAEGNATIKAYVNPEYTNGKDLSDEVGIVVGNPSIHVTNAQLNAPDTLNTSGGTRQFKVNITPTNTTDEVNISWSNSNPNIASIDAKTGVVTPKAEGNTIITATVIASYYNGTTKTISYSSTLTKSIKVNDTGMPQYRKGDVNKDGYVNSIDAALVLDIFKNGGATQENYNLGDMNEDNVLSSTDAAMILDIFKNS